MVKDWMPALYHIFTVVSPLFLFISSFFFDLLLQKVYSQAVNRTVVEGHTSVVLSCS